VRPVTANTAGVSREAARADLQRRVAGEFMPAAARAIGVDAWRNLSPGEQAAITSVAYNYGSGRIPSSVIAAARTGDAKQIGMAIEGLRDANEGINAGRRDREAQIAMMPQAPDAPGIGNGTGGGAAPDTTVTGNATMKIQLAGFPQGTRSSIDARGDFWGAPPKVEQFMPAAGSQ